MASKMASQMLMQQLKELQKTPPPCISVGLGAEENLFKWEVMFIMPEGRYEGAFFKAIVDFPTDFPNQPPKVTFTPPVYHPNVYPDGKVCISILHPPGTDRFNEMESADERWRPIISVEAVLVSITSMLTDQHPNLDSPANIDAAVLYKNDKKQYKREVRKCVEASQACAF